MPDFDYEVLQNLRALVRAVDALGLNRESETNIPGAMEKCAMELGRIADALQAIADKIPPTSKD